MHELSLTLIVYLASHVVSADITKQTSSSPSEGSQLRGSEGSQALRIASTTAPASNAEDISASPLFIIEGDQFTETGDLESNGETYCNDKEYQNERLKQLVLRKLVAA